MSIERRLPSCYEVLLNQGFSEGMDCIWIPRNNLVQREDLLSIIRSFCVLDKDEQEMLALLLQNRRHRHRHTFW